MLGLNRENAACNCIDLLIEALAGFDLQAYSSMQAEVSVWEAVCLLYACCAACSADSSAGMLACKFTKTVV